MLSLAGDTGLTFRRLRQHARFLAAALLGLVAWAVLSRRAEPHGFLVAGDVFFGAYLLLTAATAARAGARQFRERAAAYGDEGIAVIGLMTLGAVALSLGSVFAVLAPPGPPSPGQLALILVSIPLAWLTLHTIAAFHYAHRYYRKAEPGAERQPDAGGLDFPRTPEPVASDFLYHAFVVGMAAQVSDVQVVDAGMRRLTLAHGIVSFFFNTVIVALAVSALTGH